MTGARATLEHAFPYELDEIIERVLLTYRPILANAAVGVFRYNLLLAIVSTDHLLPLMDKLSPGELTPVHATDLLTAGQVTLLGGTRPMRIPHAAAWDLSIRLDGGSKESVGPVRGILSGSLDALRSFAKHHPLGRLPSRNAAARAMQALVETGTVAQIASTVGAIYRRYAHNPERLDDDHDDEAAAIRQHFLGTLHAFGRVALTPKDLAVFHDYYVECAKIREIAEERDREVHEEVERRQAFLKRLRTGLEAVLGIYASEGIPVPGRADLRSTPPARILAEGLAWAGPPSSTKKPKSKKA